MWRGFNHEGEAPMTEDELESRRKMFHTPSARMDLKIVVVHQTANLSRSAACVVRASQPLRLYRTGGH